MVRKKIRTASKKAIDNKKFLFTTAVFVIIFLGALIVYSMYTGGQSGDGGFANRIISGLQGQQAATTPLNKKCTTDSDCVLYDQTRNCGCYNKDALPEPTGEECDSLMPTACACLDDGCYGVFRFGTR